MYRPAGSKPHSCGGTHNHQMSNGGGRANRRGQMLEAHTRGLLAEEYERISKQRFFAARCLDQPIYAEQVPVGTNIYGRKRVVDFILWHPRRWADCLVLQCKWQASGGSVDEKYPFEVECIEQGLYPSVIVLDGGGYSEGAKQWLMSKRGGKLVDVCDMGEMSRMQAQGRL